jgi:DNA-directed RNA polymerase
MFVLNDVFPSLKLLTQYLKDVAHICSKLEISIPWTLPTGLVANQSYMKLKDVRIKPLNYSKFTFNLKIADPNKLDKDKQIRAFMPNLIHSLDAASLVILINNYFLQSKETNVYCPHMVGPSEYKNIYAIHDCFAVTAKNVDFIINNLKMIYILIYANKGYLFKLNNEIINHIKNHIGNDFDQEKLIIHLDKQKSLKFPDITEVLKEKYDITLLKDSAYIIN